MATARKATVGKHGKRKKRQSAVVPKVKSDVAQVAATPGVGLILPSVEHRHEMFAHVYVESYNATDAYQRVYGDQVSRRAAEVLGSNLLRNARVAHRIGELKTAQKERMHIAQDEPVRALRSIMNCDPLNVFTGSGDLKDIREIDDDTRLAISSVKIRRYPNQNPMHTFETVEVKFWDKQRAAESMARILGLTKDVPATANTIIEKQVVVLFGERIEF